MLYSFSFYFQAETISKSISSAKKQSGGGVCIRLAECGKYLMIMHGIHTLSQANQKRSKGQGALMNDCLFMFSTHSLMRVCYE